MICFFQWIDRYFLYSNKSSKCFTKYFTFWHILGPEGFFKNHFISKSQTFNPISYTDMCVFVYSYVCVCVHVEVHVCVFTFVSKCAYMYACGWAWICMYVCMYDVCVRSCVFACVCVCVWKRLCVRACMYVCKCVRVFVYVCTFELRVFLLPNWLPDQG